MQITCCPRPCWRLEQASSARWVSEEGRVHCAKMIARSACDTPTFHHPRVTGVGRLLLCPCHPAAGMLRHTFRSASELHLHRRHPICIALLSTRRGSCHGPLMPCSLGISAWALVMEGPHLFCSQRAQFHHLFSPVVLPPSRIACRCCFLLGNHLEFLPARL